MWDSHLDRAVGRITKRLACGHSFMVVPNEGVEAMDLTSIDLGFEARAILNAARHADDPSELQRRRAIRLLRFRPAARMCRHRARPVRFRGLAKASISRE